MGTVKLTRKVDGYGLSYYEVHEGRWFLGVVQKTAARGAFQWEAVAQQQRVCMGTTRKECVDTLVHRYGGKS